MSNIESPEFVLATNLMKTVIEFVENEDGDTDQIRGAIAIFNSMYAGAFAFTVGGIRMNETRADKAKSLIESSAKNAMKYIDIQTVESLKNVSFEDKFTRALDD